MQFFFSVFPTLTLISSPEHFHDFTLSFYGCLQWCTTTAFTDAMTVKCSVIVDWSLKNYPESLLNNNT